MERFTSGISKLSSAVASLNLEKLQELKEISQGFANLSFDSGSMQAIAELKAAVEGSSSSTTNKEPQILKADIVLKVPDGSVIMEAQKDFEIKAGIG